MRKLIFALILFTQLATPTAKHTLGQRPVPPGVRDADKQINSAPGEAPLPPKPKQVSVKQLQEEAAELSHLSAGIPERIDYVSKGQMPKDLNDHLKRIEKLAKHMRSEIYP
jgi:hypothetical protein